MSSSHSSLSGVSVDANTAAATIREAISYAEEGRESHVRWAEHLAAHADGSCERCTPEVVETAGDAEVQREWVRKYDVILAGLRFALDPQRRVILLDAIARVGYEVERDYRVKNARRALRYRALLADTERERDELRIEHDASKTALREFEHVAGEPLSETATVAAEAFAFSQHRAASAEERAERAEQQLAEERSSGASLRRELVTIFGVPKVRDGQSWNEAMLAHIGATLAAGETER